MAIKMVEDEPGGSKQDYRSKSRKGNSSKGIAGPVGNIAGALIPFLLKKPKLLIVLIIIGVVLYFLFGRSGQASNLVNSDNIKALFSTGGNFNKEIYEQTEIFEPLADNKKNPLPEKFSLEKYCPKRLNQGKQGSCVAWASAYAARTILEAQRTGKDPNSIRFSPSFMYNQISLDHSNCQGSYIKYAMDNLMKVGAVNFSDFRYDDNDCSKKPNSSLISEASSNKIKGFQRLTEESKGKSYEMLAMKQNLAKGSPVIIGMMVGGTFMSKMKGREMWNPTNSDYNQSGFGGHAMCVIGYDDYKEGGSFQIMNSWGEDWGNKGLFWIKYSDFKEFNREAYGLYPMGNANEKEQRVFKGSFALELNSGKQKINLEQVSDFYFETTRKLKSSDKFKIEFTNNVACYTYIFGEEDDKSASVLFPYTAKHSPYCGITGTRLFPRDYSMVPNEKGDKDKFAIVISKTPLDYEVYQKKINSASGSDFETKLKNAFKNNNSFTTYSNSSLINFEIDAKSNDLVLFVIGVKK